MTVVDLYTIQIVNDWSALPLGGAMGASVEREIIAECEENLTDLLPPGYRARIRRWDDFTNTPTQEGNDE